MPQQKMTNAGFADRMDSLQRKRIDALERGKYAEYQQLSSRYNWHMRENQGYFDELQNTYQDLRDAGMTNHMDPKLARLLPQNFESYVQKTLGMSTDKASEKFEEFWIDSGFAPEAARVLSAQERGRPMDAAVAGPNEKGMTELEVKDVLGIANQLRSAGHALTSEKLAIYRSMSPILDKHIYEAAQDPAMAEQQREKYMPERQMLAMELFRSFNSASQATDFMTTLAPSVPTGAQSQGRLVALAQSMAQAQKKHPTVDVYEIARTVGELNDPAVRDAVIKASPDGAAALPRLAEQLASVYDSPDNDQMKSLQVMGLLDAGVAGPGLLRAKAASIKRAFGTDTASDTPLIAAATTWKTASAQLADARVRQMRGDPKAPLDVVNAVNELTRASLDMNSAQLGGSTYSGRDMAAYVSKKTQVPEPVVSAYVEYHQLSADAMQPNPVTTGDPMLYQQPVAAVQALQSAFNQGAPPDPTKALQPLPGENVTPEELQRRAGAKPGMPLRQSQVESSIVASFLADTAKWLDQSPKDKTSQYTGDDYTTRLQEGLKKEQLDIAKWIAEAAASPYLNSVNDFDTSPTHTLRDGSVLRLGDVVSFAELQSLRQQTGTLPSRGRQLDYAVKYPVMKLVSLGQGPVDLMASLRVREAVEKRGLVAPERFYLSQDQGRKYKPATERRPAPTLAFPGTGLPVLSADTRDPNASSIMGDLLNGMSPAWALSRDGIRKAADTRTTRLTELEGFLATRSQDTQLLNSFYGTSSDVRSYPDSARAHHINTKSNIDAGKQVLR